MSDEHYAASGDERPVTVIEPTAIRNVIVDASHDTDATALRDLADWLDDQPEEWQILSIGFYGEIDHSGPRITETRQMSVIVEQIGVD